MYGVSGDYLWPPVWGGLGQASSSSAGMYSHLLLSSFNTWYPLTL